MTVPMNTSDMISKFNRSACFSKCRRMASAADRRLRPRTRASGIAVGPHCECGAEMVDADEGDWSSRANRLPDELARSRRAMAASAVRARRPPTPACPRQRSVASWSPSLDVQPPIAPADPRARRPLVGACEREVSTVRREAASLRPHKEKAIGESADQFSPRQLPPQLLRRDVSDHRDVRAGRLHRRPFVIVRRFFCPRHCERRTQRIPARSK